MDGRDKPGHDYLEYEASRRFATGDPCSLSAPPEQALDVGELELDIGRAAVVALAGAGRLLHLAQKRVHLLGLERRPERTE